MSENVSPKSLALLVRAHPDAEAALAFLERKDAAEVYSASTSVFPAKHWLDTYRTQFAQMAKKGTTVRGGDAFLRELEKLSPQEPVSLSAYEAEGQLGLFWFNKEEQLVGFAILTPKK